MGKSNLIISLLALPLIIGCGNDGYQLVEYATIINGGKTVTYNSVEKVEWATRTFMFDQSMPQETRDKLETNQLSSTFNFVYKNGNNIPDTITNNNTQYNFILKSSSEIQLITNYINVYYSQKQKKLKVVTASNLYTNIYSAGKHSFIEMKSGNNYFKMRQNSYDSKYFVDLDDQIELSLTNKETTTYVDVVSDIEYKLKENK